MSKKQDFKALNTFLDFIKDNPDVRDMIIEAIDNAKSKDTNNPYIFDPMTDDLAERPTPRTSLLLQRLVLKTGNDPKDGVHGNLPDHLINQKKWNK